MARIRYSAYVGKHRDTPFPETAGATVGAVLAAAMADDPIFRSYILDEQGRVRKHVTLFVDGETVKDRLRLSDPVRPDSEIYIMQALSGG